VPSEVPEETGEGAPLVRDGAASDPPGGDACAPGIPCIPDAPERGESGNPIAWANAVLAPRS